MLDRFRVFLRVLLLLSAAGSSGCSCRAGPDIPDPSDGGTKDAAADAEADAGPCGMDRLALPTPPCLVAVCNTGQEIGPLHTCVVVAAVKGASCDDDKFCTSGDECDGKGACVGGATNDCGIPHGPCDAVLCYEASKSCAITPVDEGTTCTPEDLCEINGACKTGKCVGEPKPCSYSPLTECNKVACDSATGMCTANPDPAKDNSPCVLTGDLCYVNKSCQNGQCTAGTPKDCSALDIACSVGACDPQTGACESMMAPLDHPCTVGTSQCQLGTCDRKGACKAAPAPDGLACNDHEACTDAEQCSAGVCTNGAPVMSCKHWFQDSFESCPDGWTLTGDWECGTPMNVGPTTAHIGSGVIATKIANLYTVNQSFTTCTAISPIIDLTQATTPMLAFWAWDHTEGGTFDGWNLKISTDGGKTFTELIAVTPTYPLVIQNQPAWGGDHSADGWQNYTANLAAYAGKSVELQFGFRSDGATVYPGVYIDDVIVDEPVGIPLYITTASPLPDVYAGLSMSVPIARVGGSASAVWSIVPGGVNTGFLTIDPMTGVPGGTPKVADVGKVIVTVRVEEPTLPTNYEEKQFTFNVIPDAYYTSFEGACPNGWTLGDDWECGVPANVGPATAFDGTQCLATKIAANYDDLQTFKTAIATSPAIDLINSPNPTLTFRMWIDTEGMKYDGVNLKVSNDGGMTFSLVKTVMPVYPLMVAGELAWGGQQSGLGWQLVQADLSAYAGQSILLQFAFSSDSSGNFAGVYIDDLLVN